MLNNLDVSEYYYDFDDSRLWHTSIIKSKHKESIRLGPSLSWRDGFWLSLSNVCVCRNLVKAKSSKSSKYDQHDSNTDAITQHFGSTHMEISFNNKKHKVHTDTSNDAKVQIGDPRSEIRDPKSEIRDPRSEI